jgi:hypothetical protein
MLYVIYGARPLFSRARAAAVLPGTGRKREGNLQSDSRGVRAKPGRSGEKNLQGDTTAGVSGVSLVAACGRPTKYLALAGPGRVAVEIEPGRALLGQTKGGTAESLPQSLTSIRRSPRLARLGHHARTRTLSGSGGAGTGGGHLRLIIDLGLGDQL